MLPEPRTEDGEPTSLARWNRFTNQLGLLYCEIFNHGKLAAFHAAWWQHSLLEQQPWRALRSLVSVEQTPAIFEQAWEPFVARYGQPKTWK